MVLHLQKENDKGEGYVEGHVLPINSIKSYKGF